MHLSEQQVTGLTEASLRGFLSLAVPEGLYLDYKEAVSGTSDKEGKREFLKDVTAFANAAGGHVFLGVREPSDGVSLDAQLVGLDNCVTLAQDLERLASTSIDPRIPGLRIVPIPIANERSCVVVHIPPSLTRPHMVNYGAHRSFYVRHSESSFPMTTHEIREAVLVSVSAEARARLYVERRLDEVRESLCDQSPAFFLQAMPVISPDPPWAVISEPFENVIRGDARRYSFRDYCNLSSSTAPRPTIDGLLGRDQRDQPKWESEVHRNGYVSAIFRDIQTETAGNAKFYAVHSGYCDLFRSFCHLLEEFLNITGADVPYLVACSYMNARGTRLWTEQRHFRYSEPYAKQNLVWPEHLRATGQDPMIVAEDLCVELFNAFGFKEVID